VVVDFDPPTITRDEIKSRLGVLAFDLLLLFVIGFVLMFEAHRFL